MLKHSTDLLTLRYPMRQTATQAHKCTQQQSLEGLNRMSLAVNTTRLHHRQASGITSGRLQNTPFATGHHSSALNQGPGKDQHHTRAIQHSR